MKKQDKHTPGDNRRQKAQNSRMDKSNKPGSSGVNFEETRKEAFTSRTSGKNESGNFNRPRRGSHEQGSGERNKKG